MDDTQGIILAIGAVIGTVGTFVARWAATNPENPWYVRLARVFDMTQIIDSSRSLGDE